jgi:hypothetical protein
MEFEMLKITRKDAAQRRKKIIAMRKSGMKNQEISEKLGVSPAVVGTIVYNARRKGLFPPACGGSPFRAGLHLLRSSGRKYSAMGRLMDVLDALTREEVFWLVTTLPKGLTMAEHIASILRDSYAEEHE